MSFGGNEYFPNVADVIYGSYIRYDRLYEMTKFAFYGKTDSESVNIFIDVYSIVRSIYKRGSNVKINYSYAIASCIINLAIHLRAYFDTRHHVSSKIYIIYGGARPLEAFVNYYQYNSKNMIMEDSNNYLTELILDNMEVVSILCPYLHDIFCIVNRSNEFSVIASNLIDIESSKSKTPNIIYSKDALAYQLVAFKPYTFLYRPKKKLSLDNSWVVTKSTLYNAYRYGELEISKQFDTVLDVKMFSLFQAISGLRTRNMNSLKNANSAIRFLESAVQDNIFTNGYNANSILFTQTNSIERLLEGTNIPVYEVLNRFAAIDLPYQTMLYQASPRSREVHASLINLYNPQEVRDINDKYFHDYPLDLNRV
jgi:hypothetical protein